jgi:hypothetical protein
MKYVALTNRSPVPFPCRKAELSSGKVVTLRPRIGVSLICFVSSGKPICGLACTPSVVPTTVTTACDVPTARVTLIVAVSPERRVMSLRCSGLNPSFDTLTE